MRAESGPNPSTQLPDLSNAPSPQWPSCSSMGVSPDGLLLISHCGCTLLQLWCFMNLTSNFPGKHVEWLRQSLSLASYTCDFIAEHRSVQAAANISIAVASCHIGSLLSSAHLLLSLITQCRQYVALGTVDSEVNRCCQMSRIFDSLATNLGA